MTAANTHPMDDIPVRPLKFGFKDRSAEDAMWSQSSPLFAIFANAFTLHVPYFERYLVRTMGKAKRKITDEKLLADVNALIGQEAHHANAFIGFNDLLKRRYPRAEDLERHASQDFAAKMKSDDFKSMIGFTAGYETFTFLAGMMFLGNYDAWFAESDDAVKALWVWHQVEEVEHAAVAFDVYKYFFANAEWYRKRMVIVALSHIVKEVTKAYFHMCKIEGYFKSPIKAIKASWFITKLLSIMLWDVRPVFSKNYHPRNHPLATTRQNSIAIGWRRFQKSGGDVLAIDKPKMAKIMKLAQIS